MPADRLPVPKGQNQERQDLGTQIDKYEKEQVRFKPVSDTKHGNLEALQEIDRRPARYTLTAQDMLDHVASHKIAQPSREPADRTRDSADGC
jgi:hypothetical protein